VRSVDLQHEQVVFARELSSRTSDKADHLTGASVPVKGSHVFISYSHVDSDYVRRLKDHLVAHRLDVWTDEGIDYGTQWADVIETKIESCGVFVPVMTSSSRDAVWVGREIDLAQELGKRILPLLLDGRPFLRLRELQYEDVRGARMPSDRFIAALRDLTGTRRPRLARVPKEQQFLDSVSDATYRSSLERIFDFCASKGLRFEWGPSGASIRMRTPDRTEPLSIAWIFGDSGWQGLRHLSLGVDTSSLAATPSVEDLVLAYSNDALTIRGAQRAAGAALRVAIFEPETVIDVEPQLTALISRLVDDVRGRLSAAAERASD
jgi:hypothetical protein